MNSEEVKKFLITSINNCKEEQMGYIQVKSSMAFDALCFIQKQSLNNTKWMNADQIKEIQYINGLLPNDFGYDRIGMSNICLIVSTYLDSDPEQLTLDDLIRVFRYPDRIEEAVKGRIKDGFTASYLYPVLDWLKNRYAEEYVKKLTALKNICFEDLYKERIMPLVQAEIKQINDQIGKYDAESLFNNISKLKNSSKIDCANIYVSFFSAPTAFTLYGGSFLTCFCPPNSVDFYSIIAHELMHSFASNELTKLYEEYVESNEYLKNRHRALIEDYYSGNEEEFVMAAEYYLCYLSGNYTKEQLLYKAKNRYGGNCPTSVSLFELLSRESDIPTNYNDWLISQFQENRVSVTEC